MARDADGPLLKEIFTAGGEVDGQLWDGWLDSDNVSNAFCPTGEGGGQDNSCPPASAGHSAEEHNPLVHHDEPYSEEERQQQLERYQELKERWSHINNEMLPYMDHPESDEALKLLEEQKEITKQIYALHAGYADWGHVKMPGDVRDVVIIGAGPAGLSAAIGGGTEGLNTLMLDSHSREDAGGQAAHSSRIENYPGMVIGATGKQLFSNMKDQADRLKVGARYGVKVTGLDYDEKTGLKTITLSTGEKIQSRSVIIAGGLEFKKLNFPGGDSDKVSYGNAEKLKEDAKGGVAVVVGGSNGAAQAALGATQTASHVALLSRSPITKGMSDWQVNGIHDKREMGDVSLLQNDEVGTYDPAKKILTTKSGNVIPCDALGMFVGSVPALDWVHGKVDLQKDGNALKIHTDQNFMTNIPGVFAAGDIRAGSVPRVVVAAGEGAHALAKVFPYFKHEQESRGIPVKTENVARPTRLENIHAFNRIMDLAFQFDKENPYFNQTLEPMTDAEEATHDALVATVNAFCPTGEGGGVDPHCSPSGAEGKEVGTRENPVDCGGDIEKAARLLAQGKHVRLNQPEQVTTLVDKMGKMVEEAVGKGEKAPNFDLCHVSVPGTNLFCQESLGIPRVKMPQLGGVPTKGSPADSLPKDKKGAVDLTEGFIAHCKAEGIDVEEVTTLASHLRASQNELNGVKIAGMVGAAQSGKFDLSKGAIFVTKDNYVIDGHHRWAAAVVQNYRMDKHLRIPVHRLNMDIGKALTMANDYSEKMGIPHASVANRKLI